jgi:L-serine/L-threonine ammonia-lyase
MSKREGSLIFLVLTTFSLLLLFVTGFTRPTSITMASSSGTTKTTTTSTKALAADLADGADSLYAMTPLVRSAPLSKLVGKHVYLKLDALQASGSFKDRGMAHLCATFEKEGVTELISSSGGNAGLAVATVGHQLNMSVSVIVPETTKPLVIAKLESLGAQ